MVRALAIDIGGTKFEVARVDDGGAITDRARIDSRSAVDAEALFARVVELVEPVLRLIAARRPPTVPWCAVWGSGGPMRPGGVAVSPLNIAVWRDFPCATGSRS
ncbi:MAG: hypothetical protein R2695_15970 [Acidimicrobiales bacterium]